MIRFFCIVVLFLTTTVTAQVVGCTDPHSTNYNSNATVNDGSCVYSNMSVAPLTSNVLPEILNETSGLIFWDNVLLTHNDDTDTKIYGLQQEGWQVSAEYAVPNQINTDWEEISQDEDFIYIGDFGNNAAGNRGDLRILKIAKAGFEQQQNVQIISFAYQDQADLGSVNSNATDFDCEAFIVSSDYIYLFTKQWTSMETTVYRLPKVE
ncbi:MAG: T9SS C-terminal target domain-containing protein, partial [Flavobacterium sp.]|nr:T9SS C-terminal target domain-containing protein [Flavobacterium sp.]